MTMKNSFWLGAAAIASLALGGVAVAQTAAGDAPKAPRGQRGGGMMMMADTNKDGTISRAEATAAAATNFQKMDVNKDGKIDSADRQARREQFKDRAFDRMDANDDGAVSKEEFGAPRADRADRGERAGRGDGERGPRMGGRRGGHRGGGFGGGFGGPGMGAADSNGDKAISADEYRTAYLTLFDTMDSNKDGNVTKAEMDAHHATMKAARDAKRAASPKTAQPQTPQPDTP